MAQAKPQPGLRGGTALVAIAAHGDRTGRAAPAQPAIRTASSAAFVSQLLAARERLAPQRSRRLAPTEIALGAYAEGETRGVRRLPAGSYRTRIV
jgi:hypothetical protein